MNDKLIELYLEEIYNKLIKKNYKIYIELNNWNNINNVFVLADTVPQNKISLLKLTLISKSDFVKPEMFLKVKEIKDENNKNIGLDLLIDFLKEHPELQKSFLKHSTYNIKNSYKKIIDGLAVNGEDTLRVISCFSLKYFTVSDIKPEELIGYLEEKKIDNKKIDSFLYQFYKARQTQLKDIKYASQIKDFLLKRYNSNEEKLKDYFPFLPILKILFDNEKINIFDDEYKYSTTLKINMKNLIQSLALNNWSRDLYYKNIKEILKGIVSSYNIKEFNINMEKKIHDENPQEILMLNTFHNNQVFNESVIKKDLLSFISFIKDNTDFIVTPKSIMTWCLQNKLEDKLENTEIINIKKRKL
jgi:hypothetical protein